MTSITKAINVQIPLDGTWVNVGEGPLRLSIASPINSVVVATGEIAPGDDYTGDAFILKPGSNPIDFEDVNVWVKARGTPEMNQPIWVTALPLVEAPVVIDSGNRLPGASPTATKLTYSAGQSIGGAFPIVGALGNAAGLLRSISVKSVTELTGEIDLHLFSQNPVASGFADGETAGPLEAADVPFYLGVFALTEVSSSLGVSIWQSNGIDQMVVAGTGVLFGVLVPKGSVTLDAATDITVSLGIQQFGGGGL